MLWIKRFATLVIVTAILAGATSAQTIVTVYSNNPAPGDDVTYAGTGPYVPVGSSGWFYTNVLYRGHVGIRTDLPRSGNGSVWFKGELGPGGNSSKADIEFWNVGPSGTLIPLGTLDQVKFLSYEWYRKSGSYTALSHYHPVLRLWLSNANHPFGTSSGYLVFERAYNDGTVPVPTDTWITDTINDNTVLWSTGSLPDAFSVYNKPLWKWKQEIGSYNVFAISSGIGSGWGTFEGAVDNITYYFGTDPDPLYVTTNFEVVPEPTTMALFGLGLVAVGGLMRRKRA